MTKKYVCKDGCTCLLCQLAQPAEVGVSTSFRAEGFATESGRTPTRGGSDSNIGSRVQQRRLNRTGRG